MTLDEAIIHAKEVASEELRRAGKCTQADGCCDKFSACIKCSDEHKQLAEWLEELKLYREVLRKIEADINITKCGDWIVTDTAIRIITKHFQDIQNKGK